MSAVTDFCFFMQVDPAEAWLQDDCDCLFSPRGGTLQPLEMKRFTDTIRQ